MSSKQNNINLSISRDNYEEFLLLYVDDELTADEKKKVEDFLLLHPDLQGELDVLMSTKLSPEVAQFDDKESLLADNMKLNAVDESLLLYIDDELTAAEKQEMEKRLQKEEALQLQYLQLRQTKLNPLEVIPYPYKKELYRTTKKRVTVLYRLSAAAAVFLIAGMGIFYIAEQNKQPVPATVAQRTTPKQQTGQPKQNAVHPLAQNNSLEQTTVARTPDKTGEAIKTRKIRPSAPSKAPVIRAEQEKEITTPGTLAAVNPAVVVPKTDESAVQSGIVQQKESNSTVTSGPVQAYNDTEAAVDMEPVYASQIMDEDRGRSRLKGFLRKATRMLERRANIDATTGEDELLIGAVSIKLK